MKALGWWLMLVGLLRLATVWFGFFDIWALRTAVFSRTQSTSIIWMLLQWNAHQPQDSAKLE
ncbi:ergosterol biosynthetic protein [Musa troglodytarum]|nr:ergosterol biosynthetic protein [Musa troglodytarum]